MITPAIGTTALYVQLQTLIESDIPVFIHGSPGIGKSYIVNDIAKQNGCRQYFYQMIRTHVNSFFR